MEQKKTHKEVNEPQITVQALADYMAAKSERAKRAVVQSCRYRANARVIQHNDAKSVISNHMRKGGAVASLYDRADELRNKLTDSDFESSVNEHNADYIERFALMAKNIMLPTADIERGKDFQKLPINGVLVAMRANLLLKKTTKTNKLKVGVLMLRYGKGKVLNPTVGEMQSAAIFGFLRQMDDTDGAEPDKTLCLTLDAYTGAIYPAPSNSIDLWNDMKAACASIAERWPNIAPPSSAIL